MSVKIGLIVPHVVVHNLDPHTGIPFMPHMAAHFAGALKASGFGLEIFDCFGMDSHSTTKSGQFMFIGPPTEKVVRSISSDIKIVFLYCRTVEDLISTEHFIELICKIRPDVKIGVFENIQTVNSFSLKELAPDLLQKGATVAILGEPELRARAIVDALITGSGFHSIRSVVFLEHGKPVFTEKEETNKNLDILPMPFWEGFPLEGYWNAHFAHAPVGKSKFLPILTSRGCPYRCTFCISPTLNPTWRGRSGKHVVDEMEYFYTKLGITDFHISDLDPTVQDSRTRELCQELIQRKLPLTWKVAQGTKIETIKSEETLELMAKAGCTFMSFSPETGSPRLLKIMNKPFNHEYSLKMLRKMNSLGIRTQACFIAGVPGENAEDRKLSVDFVKKLVKNGVDEIAVTIFTPLPGAHLADAIKGFSHYSQLTHSPTWREDYGVVNRYRLKMYMTFFIHKLQHPKKVIREITGFLRRDFQTKMEMSFYKVIKLRILYYFPWFYRRKRAA